MKSAFNKELTDYQKSAKEKKHMALGILHNIMSGTDKLREYYVSNPSNSSRDIILLGFSQCNQFLYAHVFELGIKSIWELSHSRVFGKKEIHKYKHNIYRIYRTLDMNAQKFMEEKYNLRVKEFYDVFKDSDLHVTVDGYDEMAVSSFPYYSFEECLQVNRKIVTEGKYEFQKEKKVNIVTGISPIPNTNGDATMTSMEPSEFLYDIIKYIEKII